MKRKTILWILTVTLPFVSFFAYVGSGYAEDAQCTLEEQGLGECDRQSDAVNNAWGWASEAGGIVAYVAALGAAACACCNVYRVFGYGSIESYWNDEVGWSKEFDD